MSTISTLKWAILGTSQISKTMAHAIQASDTAELIAIGTGSLPDSASKSAAFAREFSIPTVHASYQAVLEDPNVDVVYIGLANHLHKEWIIRCAKAGKHILCEKPLVLNVNEAQQIKSIIDQHQVFCMEALMYRCHPFINDLKCLIQDESNGIGDIKSIHAVYYSNFAQYENPIAGGAIRNLGCYPVSLIRLIMNQEPISIQSQAIMNAIGTSENMAAAIMRFENGVIAQVSTSNNTDTWHQFDVVGSTGVLRVITNPWKAESENIVVIYRNGNQKIYRFFADKSLYTYQIDTVNHHLLAQQLTPNFDAISWEHSLGNIAALEEWVKQANHSLHFS